MTSTSGSSEVTSEKKTKTTPKRSASSRARKSTTTKSKATKKATVKKTSTTKKVTSKHSTRAAKKAVAETESKDENLASSEIVGELHEKKTTQQTVRKAPTGFAARTAAMVRQRRQVIIAACLLLVGVASSAAVGFTDVGRIDINQKIAERNERIKNNQATNEDLIAGSATLPVQNTNDKVDGGLIGLVGSTPPKPVTGTSTATSTATSSLATASSTASTTEPMAPRVAGASSSTAIVPENQPIDTSEGAPLVQ